MNDTVKDVIEGQKRRDRREEAIKNSKHEDNSVGYCCRKDGMFIKNKPTHKK